MGKAKRISMKQSTKDFLAFAVLPVVAVLGSSYLINKKGPRVASLRTPDGFDLIACDNWYGHRLCVLKDRSKDDAYTFTVDGGAPYLDSNEWTSAEQARFYGREFVENNYT